MKIDFKAMWPALKQAVKDFMEDNALRLSAALAFYTMLAIAPLLIIIVKIVGMVFSDNAAKGQIEGYVNSTVGAKAAVVIKEVLDKGDQPGEGALATVISTVILMFSASGVFGELQNSLNTIWEVKPKPDRGIMGTIKDRFFSITLVLGTAFLLMASLVVSTVLSNVTKAVGADQGWVWAVLHFVIALVVSSGLFALIFKYLPDVKNKWEHVLIGAVFTGLLFTIGKYLLGWYLGRESTTSVWGAFGSLVALLMWVYYSGLILFFGAEFTQAYAAVTGDAVQPSKNAVALTEEDRAQQGIPSREQLDDAAAGRPAAARPGGRRGTASPSRRPVMPERVTVMPGGVAVTCPPVPSDPRATLVRSVLIGAGGVVVGALAGALGWERLERRKVHGVDLGERINKIETKLGRISRIKHAIEDVRVQDRIDEVRKRVRAATTTIHAEQTGRPRWLVRVGDALAGR